MKYRNKEIGEIVEANYRAFSMRYYIRKLSGGYLPCLTRGQFNIQYEPVKEGE